MPFESPFENETMRSDMAIIIPAYNEELTIRDVIIDFNVLYPTASIYVIDNNSNDATNQIAVRTLRERSIKGKVFTETRQGKSNAVRRAFREVDSDIYVMVDADMTYPAKELKQLLDPVIKGEADMVVGDRLANGKYREENSRRFHSSGNQLVKNLVNYTFRTNVSDVMSGYRVFNRLFVKNFPCMSQRFELETELTLHALHFRYRLLEIPIDYRSRPSGSKSKLNTFQDGFRVIAIILSIFKDYKPLTFFSFISALFFVLSISLGAFPVYEYFTMHYIYRVPLAILAMGLMLVSLLLFITGLILNTIANLHKFNYEHHLLSQQQR